MENNWLEFAVQEYDTTAYKDGDLLSKQWLLFALQIPAKMDSTEDMMFLFLNRFEAFREYMLIQRKIALENVRGRGYRVVPPGEQARLAADEALKLIRRGLNKGNKILANTRVHMLTNDEASRHTDAQIKLAGLQQMLGRQKTDLLKLTTK